MATPVHRHADAVHERRQHDDHLGILVRHPVVAHHRRLDAVPRRLPQQLERDVGDDLDVHPRVVVDLHPDDGVHVRDVPPRLQLGRRSRGRAPSATCGCRARQRGSACPRPPRRASVASRVPPRRRRAPRCAARSRDRVAISVSSLASCPDPRTRSQRPGDGLSAHCAPRAARARGGRESSALPSRARLSASFSQPLAPEGGGGARRSRPRPRSSCRRTRSSSARRAVARGESADRDHELGLEQTQLLLAPRAQSARSAGVGVRSPRPTGLARIAAGDGGAVEGLVERSSSRRSQRRSIWPARPAPRPALGSLDDRRAPARSR